MSARLMAFGVWTLLALSGVYWAIQLTARPLAMPAGTVAVAERSGGPADLTRLFGAPTPSIAAAVPEVPADARFKLLGVVAPKSESARAHGEGVALIAVDGVPRVVRVGAVVDGDLRLLAVAAGSASLGQAGGAVTVKLQTPVPVPGTSMPPALEVQPPAMPQLVPPMPSIPQQTMPNGAITPASRQ